MSSRQQTRVNQALVSEHRGKNSANDDESDDDEDEEITIPRKKMFQFEDDSSSDESNVEEIFEEIREKITPPNIAQKSDLLKKVAVVNDMDFLDSIIIENDKRITTVDDATVPTMVKCVWFVVEPKNLDVDRTINDRFGRNNFMQQNENEAAPPPANNRNNNNNRGVAKKRLASLSRSYLFGAPKEDWTKPLSFIGGGMHLVRTNKIHTSHINISSTDNSLSKSTSTGVVHFCFEWSVEYRRLNDLYLLVQSSGDVNRLIMFLANNPYHVEGILQLALVFARIGHMDRATDLVRRCLYCFECWFVDAFKPCSGLSRLDPHVEENRVFFQAAIKHMQFCFTLGCVALSADLCRLLVGLHPADDVHYLLLTLDFYMLSAGQYEALQVLCGVVDESSFTLATTNDSTLDAMLSLDLSNAFPLGGDHISSADSSHNATPTLSALSNWWYSLALSFYLMEADNQRKAGYNNLSATNRFQKSHSSFLLKCALLQHPYMLEQLMGQAGVSVGVFANSTWRRVFGHEYFNSSINRLPQDSYLRNVSTICSHRCGALWNTPEVHAWVLQTAGEVISLLDGDGGSMDAPLSLSNAVDIQRTRHLTLSDTPSLMHYSHARLEDFIDETPRMPNEVNNLVEPQLMDPRILAGGVRFDNAAMGLALPNIRQRRKNRHEQQQEQLAIQRQIASESDVLDLRLPLFELFLASLVPWWRVTQRADRGGGGGVARQQR